jgi:peptide-methionine (R)-S-oxide reductase
VSASNQERTIFHEQYREHEKRKEALNYNKLTPDEERVIVKKGTEPPFTGEYDNFYEEGTYICRRCNHPLFSSKSKFDAGCGWPAFDDCFPNTIKRLADPDGMRTEIECAKCGAHLGHEFSGEQLTAKNIRECVNSLSIRFIPTNRHE